MQLINIIGKKFNKLTVIKIAHRKKGKILWLCKCDCGRKTRVNGSDLRNGHTKSCGCLYRPIRTKEVKKIRKNELSKIWKKKNPDKVRESTRKYLEKNREKEIIRHKKYKEENPNCDKEYQLKNRNKINKRIQDKKRKNPLYKLTCNLRSRLHRAIKRNYKSGSAVRDLGCSIEYLKSYLEQQFTEGMSWNNYGKWQIDHQVPLSIVDLTDRKEFLHVCHYTNLQPMWAEENLSKSNRVTR